MNNEWIMEAEMNHELIIKCLKAVKEVSQLSEVVE